MFAIILSSVHPLISRPAFLGLNLDSASESVSINSWI